MRRCAVKRYIYTVLVSVMLFFIVMPPSLGATTEPYDPLEYLYKKEQDYVKSTREAITAALGAIADAKGEIGPFFTDGYQKWAEGLSGKFKVVNEKTKAIGAIAAPDTFSEVQAQAQGITVFNSDHVYNSLNPFDMMNDLAYAMQTFSNLEGGLNAVRGQVEGVSGALEGKAAALAKKNKMGADILDSMLSCEDTTT
jgi:hypothetical protein